MSNTGISLVRDGRDLKALLQQRLEQWASVRYRERPAAISPQIEAIRIQPAWALDLQGGEAVRGP